MSTCEKSFVQFGRCECQLETEYWRVGVGVLHSPRKRRVQVDRFSHSASFSATLAIVPGEALCERAAVGEPCVTDRTVTIGSEGGDTGWPHSHFALKSPNTPGETTARSRAPSPAVATSVAAPVTEP